MQQSNAVHDNQAAFSETGCLTCFSSANLRAGARRAFIDSQEKPGGADLLKLSLLTGVEEDHG